MTVFFVLEDIPLDPLLLPPLSDAALVPVEIDVLLDVLVVEKVLPSEVTSTTCVVTWTIAEVEMLWLDDETSLLEVVCEDDWVDFGVED